MVARLEVMTIPAHVRRRRVGYNDNDMLGHTSDHVCILSKVDRSRLDEDGAQRFEGTLNAAALG